MSLFRKMVDVTLVKDPGTDQERRLTVKGFVQPTIGFFQVDTPVHEDDAVEVPDPRGGVMRYVVGRVDIFDGYGHMSHLEAHWDRGGHRVAATNVSIGGSVIGGLQVASPGASQEVKVSVDATAVRDWTRQVREVLPELGLDAIDDVLARSTLDSIEAEPDRPRPRPGVLAALGTVMRRLVAPAIASGTGTAAATLLTRGWPI